MLSKIWHLLNSDVGFADLLNTSFISVESFCYRKQIFLSMAIDLLSLFSQFHCSLTCKWIYMILYQALEENMYLYEVSVFFMYTHVMYIMQTVKTDNALRKLQRQWVAEVHHYTITTTSSYCFLYSFVSLFAPFRPTRECYTHMEMSPLPVKGCKFWPMLVTQGHWAVRNLYLATPAVTRGFRLHCAEWGRTFRVFSAFPD